MAIQASGSGETQEMACKRAALNLMDDPGLTSEIVDEINNRKNGARTKSELNLFWDGFHYGAGKMLHLIVSGRINIRIIVNDPK